jgi:hypothetical protein
MKEQKYCGDIVERAVEGKVTGAAHLLLETQNRP